MIRAAIDSLLDRSILFSFDRSGYRRHQRAYEDGDLDADLTGRVCLVTGANSGLGRVTATELARRQATVWLLCRNASKGEVARSEICQETGNEDVHVAVVDVSDRRSVKRFVEDFPGSRVDVLVHNAGVLTEKREETEEGLERTLATNQIGPFLLTQLLSGLLERSEDARVIWVSSGGMYGMSLQLSDPDWRMREFDGVRAYAETKRAQVVLNELWGRRWADSGITTAAMHPGWADTPGVRRSLPRFWKRMQGRLRTPAEGADTIVWLCVASSEKLQKGRFWFDRQPVSEHLVPWTRESEDEKQRLWQLCSEFGQVRGRKETVV